MKEPDDRWFKIINAKYLDDKGFFLDLMGQRGPNFGRPYTGSSIFLNGGWYTV
jgi:hypothetical protein